MKIAYLASSKIPSREANSVHVMKMVNAIRANGVDCILVVPKYKGLPAIEGEDLFSHYGVSTFPIVFFPWHQFPTSKYIYSIALAVYLKLRGVDLVYTRDFYPALHSTLFRIPTIMEFHSMPNWGRGLYKPLAKRFYCSRFLLKNIVISEAMRQLFLAEKIPPDKLEVAHDGSDESVAKPNSYPLTGAFKVGYVGHLYQGRGIDLIIELARRNSNIDFHLAGGTDKDIKYWTEKTKLHNLHFQGFISPKGTDAFRKSCDVLLAPYQRKVLISDGKTDSSGYMSPLKIFEYMSAGKAIIASDLPVLREVLNNKNAMLCDPDKVEVWDQALLKLKNDSDFYDKLAHSALKDFEQNYVWKVRAKNLLREFIEEAH